MFTPVVPSHLQVLLFFALKDRKDQPAQLVCGRDGIPLELPIGMD